MALRCLELNVVVSSIAREADSVLYTWAGPEISVATTKAYSTQLAAIYLIGLLFGEIRGVLGEKEISNLVEVRSRGASVLGLTTYGNYAMEDIADFTVYVPRTRDYFATSLAVVPLQLLAYYISVAKGLDVDKPRNLAKSVTVE